ncbi:MAG: transcription termination factor NusA [Candidatus Neomarinimicrobiota bacterium]
MINREIIEAFSQIAREKNVDRSELGDIIEKVFLTLIEKKYNSTENFSVIVNMDKGEIEIYHQMTIVDKPGDSVHEITLENARKTEPDMEVGDPFIEIIDPLSFGRRLISHAKQILNQQIVRVEKNQIYEEYSRKIGQIIIGDVHQIRRDAIFIIIGKAELKMPREEQIPNERYRRGENIKAIIKEALMGPSGPEIIVSRADKSFLVKLFENEVPEIYDKTIEIKKVARHAGDRSKVIVESNDRRIDAVGACVGIKGSRIQAIVRELNNEKIDIINNSSESEILITRALSPAKPIELEIDEEKRSALAIFADDEISVAIGKMGQNIRLASEVTSYSIDAIKKSDYELTESETIYLEDIDGITEHNWKLLYSYGIETTEEYLSTPREEMLSIKGLGAKTLDKIEPIIIEAQEKRKAEVEATRATARAQREATLQNAHQSDGKTSVDEEEIELSDDDIIQEEK